MLVAPLPPRDHPSFRPAFAVACASGDGGEARRFAQHAKAEAEVQPARLHKGFPAARANDFLADFEAPSLQAHCSKGFFTAHPVLYLLFGSHLLVGAKLLIQLPLDLFLSEE